MVQFGARSVEGLAFLYVEHGSRGDVLRACTRDSDLWDCEMWFLLIDIMEVQQEALPIHLNTCSHILVRTSATMQFHMAVIVGNQACDVAFILCMVQESFLLCQTSSLRIKDTSDPAMGNSACSVPSFIS